MKKARLLEIVREEISSALNEIPFISPSQYDIAYDKETGEVEKGILGKAIENAVNVIKGMGVESTPEISKIITAKKARTSPNSPPELVLALTAIDDAVLKQGETFDDMDVLKIVQKMASQPKSDLPDLSAYVSGEKTFSDKLQRPQTEKAIDRISGIEPGKRGRKADPNKPEKPASTGKRGRPAGSGGGTKVATRTPGDDGFDDVTYSDAGSEAPSGDVEMEKAARGRDELIKQYKNVMDTYKTKKEEEGDEAAIEYLKTKQDIVKKYKKAKEVNA